jgi:hygromycin-B 7''-O-kinase
MHALPSVKNIEAYHAWRADTAQCLPAALDIARSHRLPHGEAHLFSTGTNLVVALDDALVLKVFPPLLRHQFVSERASLSQLRGASACRSRRSCSKASATDGRISSSRG